MSTRWIRLVLAGSALVVGGAPAVEAQLGDLAATGYTGVAVPFGKFADYADVGVSAGLQLEYPLTDPLDLVVDAGLDDLNSGMPGLPDFRLWRYEAGLATDLFGNSAERWGLRAHLGAGATSFRTGGFYPSSQPTAETFSRTYFTGGGGLSLVFGADSPVHGFLGARIRWTPVEEDHLVAMRSAAIGAPPQPFEHAVSVPITLGLRIRA
jgi:hypothetical protein